MAASWARPLLLATLTGFLYPLCFPGHDHTWLAWVVLVPLHVAIRELQARRAFWIGWLSGLVAFAGTMFWVVNAMHLYGKMPLGLAYAIMLLLATYLGLYVGVYTWGLRSIQSRWPTLSFLPGPFLWVTLELLRTYAFSGLPWGLFGYSQYRWITTIQIADITGVYGVSFYLVLVNVAVTEVLAQHLLPRSAQRDAPTTASPPSSWVPAAAAGATVLLVLAYGLMRLSSASMSGTEQMTVGVVQPNIDQAQKWDEAFRRETMDRYIRLTRQIGPQSDLVIWPEAATPFVFEQERPYRLELAALAHAQGAPILFGSPAVRYYANGRPYLLNSAYLFSADGEILGRYDKQHLVPFGEYIPLRTLLFFLDKLVEGIGDFEAGTVPTVLRLPASDGQPEAKETRFGVVICFEVIFPNLVREFVREGADFMVTITNDAWFGVSTAPYQHFGMVVFRAVENHVAFARAANTGISGFIDPYGRILETTPLFRDAAIQRSIPRGSGPTFYSRQGDFFAYGCVIITGIFGVPAWLQWRRDRRGSDL